MISTNTKILSNACLSCYCAVESFIVGQKARYNFKVEIGTFRFMVMGMHSKRHKFALMADDCFGSVSA